MKNADNSADIMPDTSMDWLISAFPDMSMHPNEPIITANDKAQDLTIRKLTRNNPTMKQKFEEARKQNGLPDGQE